MSIEPNPIEPTEAVVVDRAVSTLWKWARGYIKHFGWTLSPVWLARGDVPGGVGRDGCCCPDGEGCPTAGKHLVSGLGVAREEEDVERAWPATHPQVKAGQIGIAAMTGSQSKLLVLDVGSAFALTRTRFKVAEHVLTQQTPTEGEHWFFQLGDGEAVIGGRTEIELVTDCLVLGDGTFVVLGPRRGYSWVGGSNVLVDSGPTDVPEALRLVLSDRKLLGLAKDIHHDDPWRTAPGTPLVGVPPRTYTRQGDIRRLVDEFGHRVTFTPGLGWRVWNSDGWGGPDRSMQSLKSMLADLPSVHRREGHEAADRGDTGLADRAKKWSVRAASRASGSVISDLESDDRILIPTTQDWDTEGWVAGLPVKAGVGRLVNLRTGEVERDQISRRVSRQLGATYDDSPGGSLAYLWHQGTEGRGGKYFVKYITDLQAQYGEEWVRLLQRATGASLYGRRGVNGDTDAVFVLKGPTRSGKSTISECLLAVAGQYGKAVGSNLLFGDKGNPEFSDAAVLGYRVMTLSEPPMRAELNTTKLKQLSGGDTITGRAPYGREEITFIPEVSLWLLTNHALEVTDEAVWRRLKIFEFSHSWDVGKGEIPELRKAVTTDPAELRLAFAWMLAGARDWFNEGWGSTETWRETATIERAKHDPIARWVSECVEVTGSPLETFTHADMMSNFDYWLVVAAETKPAMSRNALRDELEGAAIRAGLKFDRTKRLLAGGRLR